MSLSKNGGLYNPTALRMITMTVSSSTTIYFEVVRLCILQNLIFNHHTKGATEILSALAFMKGITITYLAQK